MTKISQMISDFQHFTFKLGKCSTIFEPKKFKFVHVKDVEYQQELRDLWNEYYYINQRPSISSPAWADIDRNGTIQGETLEEYYIRIYQKPIPNNPNFTEIIDNCKNRLPWYTKHHRTLMRFRNEVERKTGYIT